MAPKMSKSALRSLLFLLNIVNMANSMPATWPGNSVAEKVRLLKRIRPTTELDEVWRFCLHKKMEFQRRLDEGELGEHLQREAGVYSKRQGRRNEFFKQMEEKLFARSFAEINRKLVLRFVDCVEHANQFNRQWDGTLRRMAKRGDLKSVDALLDQLKHTIANKLEAFNELLEANEAFGGVFEIPEEQQKQLEVLRDYDLWYRMKDEMVKIKNGVGVGDGTSSGEHAGTSSGEDAETGTSSGTDAEFESASSNSIEQDKAGVTSGDKAGRDAKIGNTAPAEDQNSGKIGTEAAMNSSGNETAMSSKDEGESATSEDEAWVKVENEAGAEMTKPEAESRARVGRVRTKPDQF